MQSWTANNLCPYTEVVSLKIELDHARFRNIVRGKIRKNLKDYISHDELLGKKGKEVVSIPVPQIDIPRFRLGNGKQGGVGQGEGNPGDPLSQGDPQPGQGGEAGEGEGQHVMEVDVSLEELADILGEELSLPRIEPRGSQKIDQIRERYVGIRRVGPNSLRHFKRSYRNAMRRQISMGSYDPENPVIIPARDDMRYKSWKEQTQPLANAVVVYMMDVSGSMGQEQKDIVRLASFWLDLWIQRHYKDTQTRFIIHDAVAREVDRDTFFHTRESGGTMISSAYKEAIRILDADYPPEDWNIYLFHFSDGDNWSIDDTSICMELLRDRLLPMANLFGYGQVHSPYGSGQFLKDVQEQLKKHEEVVCADIRGREQIVQCIQAFLGGGR